MEVFLKWSVLRQFPDRSGIKENNSVMEGPTPGLATVAS